MNLYAYADGSPTTRIDPLGLWCEWLRLPDFISMSFSITIPTPWTATLFSWTFSGSLDRYGHWYWSPIGPGLGRAPLAASGTLTANWLIQKDVPTSDQLSNFLSGHGVSAAAGYWGGMDGMYSPGNGYAAGFGIVSPQAGANYSYSYQSSGNTGLKW
jgi:hypothetical protein